MHPAIHAYIDSKIHPCMNFRYSCRFSELDDLTTFNRILFYYTSFHNIGLGCIMSWIHRLIQFVCSIHALSCSTCLQYFSISFNHIFIYSFIRSFTRPFIHSLIHSMAYSFTYAFVSCSMRSVIHSFIHVFFHFIHLCIHVNYPLLDSVMHLITDSLIPSIVIPSIDLFICFYWFPFSQWYFIRL